MVADREFRKIAATLRIIRLITAFGTAIAGTGGIALKQTVQCRVECNADVFPDPERRKPSPDNANQHGNKARDRGVRKLGHSD